MPIIRTFSPPPRNARIASPDGRMNVMWDMWFQEIYEIERIEQTAYNTLSTPTISIGGLAAGQVSTATDYTMTPADYAVWCNGNVTITLPASAVGTIYVVANVGTTSVSVVSSGTINGASGVSVSLQWHSITLQTDGTNWIII